MVDPQRANAGIKGQPQERARLQDVAALAGVSIKTTSRILNCEKASAGATSKVLDAAKLLRYRPNGIARELRSGAISNGVGMIVSDLSNPFYSKMAYAAEEILAKEGFDLFIASTDEDPQREEGLVKRMLERRTQALLLVPSSPDHSYLKFEMALGSNIIFLDRPPVNLLADSFVSNDRQAAREIVAELKKSHRRVAVIGDEQIAWTAKERLAGAVEELGADSPLIQIGAHRPEKAEEIAIELLGRAEPPTALLGLNNLITLGILQALKKCGRSCSVVGFDDSDVLQMFEVTALNVDPERIGELAAQRALKRISNPDLAPINQLLEMRKIHRTPLDRPIIFPERK